MENVYERIATKDLNNQRNRIMFSKYFSFAIPNEDALETISKYSPIVEIGAGNGYWARLLQERGCSTLPFDAFTKNNPYGQIKPWTTVYQGTEDVLTKFTRKVNLLLCWPPYDEPMATNCLKHFRGEYVLYIGEGWYGCTADNAFHTELNNWDQVDEVSIPRWAGMHDWLTVYRRRR
jgi:hypothetical protein